jgi:hypothetical protein
MYRHVLEVHSNYGNWLFLHYEQVLGGPGIARFAAHVAAPVNPCFVDASLNRSPALPVSDEEVIAVYERLCQRAGYSGSAEHRVLSRLPLLAGPRTGERCRREGTAGRRYCGFQDH